MEHTRKLGGGGGWAGTVKETNAGMRIGRGFAIRRLCCFQTLVVGFACESRRQLIRYDSTGVRAGRFFDCSWPSVEIRYW
jgi:hypothetical protein